MTAILPAYNEAQTISDLIKTLQAVPEVDEVIVVSDGSTDATADVAREAGATVLELERNKGKGAAMFAGAKLSSQEVLLFLDADLKGLLPEQVVALIKPVAEGEADMAIGVFKQGRHLTDWAQVLAPNLSGQRAIKRELFLKTGLEESRYDVEIKLTHLAEENFWRVAEVPLINVSHVMKEEKRGLLPGFIARLGMYRDIARYCWHKEKKRLRLLRPAILVLVLFLLLGLGGYDLLRLQGARAEARNLPLFSLADSERRILVFAPHPDDETLAAGGLINQATSQGDAVAVVFLTNGDAFRRSLEKELDAKPAMPDDFLNFGYRRQEEALRALAVLGVQEDNIFFLGYPDRGLEAIWRRYWDRKLPYSSPYTKKNAVPYQNAFSPGAPYIAPAILQDLDSILEAFRPTEVYLPDTEDTHSDHRAGGFFGLASIASCKQKRRDFQPQIYTYLIHAGSWQLAPVINHNVPLVPPKKFLQRENKWVKYPLSPPVRDKKRLALSQYKTQLQVMRNFMSNFDRPNEIFYQLPENNFDELIEKFNTENRTDIGMKEGTGAR